MDKFLQALNGAVYSRQIWAAILLAVLGSLQATSATWAVHFTPSDFGWTMVGIAAAIAVLRVITTVPLADRAPQ